MLFNSFIYPFFLATSVVVYWLLPRTFRVWFLIAVSMFFYGFNDIRFLALIVVMAVGVWCAKYLLQKTERQDHRSIFLITITVIVGVLVWFKYRGLLVESFQKLLHLDPGAHSILLPLGISFFTFEFIHYLTDVYAKRIAPHTFLDFFSFALFFPTLASGPIKRFQPFLTSLKNLPRFPQAPVFMTGLWLIVVGYAQKYLVADILVERTAFLSTPELAPSSMAVISGLFLYSIRLYADFAGLSSIAIGSALLFGITVPINFSYPYFRSDLASFWKHWHMSLTSWIRDYVYMPIVFHFRHKKAALALGVIATMALIGLWHGSSWNFLVFGLYHGVGLAFLQLLRARKRRPTKTKLRTAFGIVATFIYVTLGWPLFVTSSLSDSILLYRHIFGFIG